MKAHSRFANYKFSRFENYATRQNILGEFVI